MPAAVRKRVLRARGDDGHKNALLSVLLFKAKCRYSPVPGRTVRICELDEALSRPRYARRGKAGELLLLSYRAGLGNMPGLKGPEDFDFANWFGLLARAGTPQPVLDKLAAAAIGALKEPKVREVLENPGGRSDRPAEFRAFIRSESAKLTPTSRRKRERT